MVDTATGRVVREWQAERDTQLSVVGGRVIASTAVRRDGICVVSVTGYDAATALPVWGPHPTTCAPPPGRVASTVTAHVPSARRWWRCTRTVVNW